MTYELTKRYPDGSKQYTFADGSKFSTGMTNLILWAENWDNVFNTFPYVFGGPSTYADQTYFIPAYA
jgi:hypothetical protein